MDKGDIQELKQELEALLKKYNATIQFVASDSSDTHGIYEGHIEVHVNDKKVLQSGYDDWYMSSNNIE